MTPDDPLERLRRLERVTAGSLDGYWERNLRTNRSWYSPSFRMLFGFCAEELPDDRNVVNTRIHPEDWPSFEAAYTRAIAQVGRFSYELRYRDARGQWRWVRGRGQAWPGADGRAEFITGAVSDIHAEKVAQQSLEEANGRFERAIEASEEGLFERIEGEPAILMSDRFLSLIGFTRHELPADRRWLLERFHPDDLEEFNRVVTGGVAALGRWEVRFRFRHACGDYRWYRQRGVARQMPDGRVRVTGMIADVHELTLQRQELERTRSQLETLVAERTARLAAALSLARERQIEAERANAAKSRFLAHMSHEIRTPLNGVLGLLDLARRAAPTPDLQRYLDTANHSGQSLLQVINAVLDFSRIEAGRLELRPEPFDLAAILVDTVRAVMPLVRERALMMLFDWVEGPSWVLADPAAVRQVITNLVGNAVKFTERGHVQVVGRSQLQDDGRLLVQVVVRDTGPGIPAEVMGRIFDAFEQGDASLARLHGGTGLGLSIARSLAAAMDGDITASSPADGGCQFTVTLRLKGADAPAVPTPRPDGEAWLVHATPLGAQWLEKRLARLGWRTRALGTVDELLALARAQTPQLVLLSESGLTHDLDLRPIRAAFPDIPMRLLVRPDWHSPGLETEAQALGIGTVLTPVTPVELLRLTQVQAPPKRVRPEPGLRAPTWPAGSRVLLVEDNPVNQLIGQEFLRVLGCTVRTAGDGAQALVDCVDFRPQLVLMDLQMPGMDGLEATRELRRMQQEDRWPGAPIVALTAHAAPADHAACLAAGMDGVLTKPLALDALWRELDRNLRSGP